VQEVGRQAFARPVLESDDGRWVVALEAQLSDVGLLVVVAFDLHHAGC